jgi:hypothetical protein
VSLSGKGIASDKTQYGTNMGNTAIGMCQSGTATGR